MALIAAWYVPSWHDNGSGARAWSELPTPLTELEFEAHIEQCDDDYAEEGVFAEGLVRLDDGRELPFRVEKTYSVDCTLEIDDEDEVSP